MSNEFKAVKQKFLRVWLNVKRNLSYSSGGIVPSKAFTNFKLPIRGERMYKVIKCAYCGEKIGYESLADITIKAYGLEWCDTVCQDTWLDEKDLYIEIENKCIQCDNPAYQRNGKVYKLCARCGWEAIKEVCELNEKEAKG